jgi:hypothetical protein
MTKIRTLTAIAGLLLITACGGGEKSSAAFMPTKAAVKLSSAGTGMIYGIDLTINLATGVSVKSSNPPQTDAGVVSASGVAASGSVTTGVYTAATGTFPATLRILVANPNGFSTGEFCTVNADIALGRWPTSGEFSIGHFSASDENGSVIDGLTGELTVGIL